jgi:hypothetical protein
MFGKPTRSIACSLALLLVAPLCASAQELKETFWLISKSWKLVESKASSPSTSKGSTAKTLPITYQSFELEIQDGNKLRKFPVNLLMLAHTTSCDTTSEATYKLAMIDYLKGVKKISNADALIKLGSNKQGGPLEVAGIWQFNSEQAWKKAITQGSQIMNLSASQVRQFGSADSYKAELVKRTKSQWTQIDSRKAN